MTDNLGDHDVVLQRTTKRPRPYRRWYMFTVGALGLAMLATGCGKSGSSPAADAASCSNGSKVSLGLSWWGTDSRAAYFKKIIALYENDNPNVTIKPTYAGFADYFDRLATSAAGGSAPDVMAFDFYYIREYADRGALLDLSKYVPGTIDNKDFDPSMAKIGMNRGHLWAIPTGAAPFTMLANPQVFKQAGIALPDDKTWTYDEYIKTAAALTTASPKGTYGTMTTDYEPSLDIFVRQRGQSLFTEDGKVGFTKQTAADWWNYQQQLIKTGGAPPASIAVELKNAPIDASLMAKNQAGMSEAFINYLGVLDRTSKSDIVPLRYPGEARSKQPGLFMKPAQFWAASSRTACPTQASKLINFLLNDTRVAALMLTDRGLPINVKLREEISPKLNPADQKMADYLKQVAPGLAAPPPLPPPGGKVDPILLDLNEQVLFGRITTDQAADQLITRLKAAIHQS